MRLRSSQLFRPPVADRLAVALVAGTEDDQLDPVRPALELPGDARREAHRVKPGEVDDGVVELHPAAAADHDVDLLGLVVPVGERLALPRLDAVEADAGLLGVEVAARETCLLPLRGAETDRRCTRA